MEEEVVKVVVVERVIADGDISIVPKPELVHVPFKSAGSSVQAWKDGETEIDNGDISSF